MDANWTEFVHFGLTSQSQAATSNFPLETFGVVVEKEDHIITTTLLGVFESLARFIWLVVFSNRFGTGEKMVLI